MNGVNDNLNRRDALKALGLVAGATLAPAALRAASSQDTLSQYPQTTDYRKPKRPVSVIVIGAGGRGNLYASYARNHRDEWKVVGVAEPIEYRNERMAKNYNIPDEHRFVTWEHVFDKPKFADAVIISTPDDLHYGPAMKALELGYDVLLEKVVAQTWRECKDILDLATKNDRIVAVCHVLRYAPYFRQLRHVVQSGMIGEIVSVQHLEPVDHIHMSHAFVRGNWGNSKKSNPMIMSKSCHDLDILRWVIGKPCRKITSFGGLRLFREEMAPPGSTARCTDGCAVESTCPFSALKIYQRENLFSKHHLHAADHSEASILKALKEGPYGRCVWRCDNDVVDHQVTNLEFDDNVTAAFSMEGLCSYEGRRTRVTGTQGDIIGDMRTLDVFQFATRKRLRWSGGEGGGHGGGDFRLVRDFVQAVSQQDASLLTSTLDASMESHLMGFKAEESRLQGGAVLPVDLDSA